MIAFCIVEDDDRGGNVLHEVHGSLDAAIDAAETWKTRDRSNGGRPYTWVRIIEQEGAEVLNEWRFDVEAQAWVGAKTGIAPPKPTRNPFDASAFDAANELAAVEGSEVEGLGAHDTDEPEPWIGGMRPDGSRRGKPVVNGIVFFHSANVEPETGIAFRRRPRSGPTA